MKPKQKRPAPATALEALTKARQVRFEKTMAVMEAKKAGKEKMAEAVAVCTLSKQEPAAAPAPTPTPAVAAPPSAAPDPLVELTQRLHVLLQEKIAAAPPKPVKRATRKPKPVQSSCEEEEVIVPRKKKPVQRDTDYLAYKTAQTHQQLEHDERTRLKNLGLR